MGRGSTKTNNQTTRNEKSQKPYVVGLGSIPGVHNLDGVDLDNSYVVYLNKRNKDHVRQLILFVKWLNENNRSNFEETEEMP